MRVYFEKKCRFFKLQRYRKMVEGGEVGAELMNASMSTDHLSRPVWWNCLMYLGANLRAGCSAMSESGKNGLK